jgi:hypothetical protein
MADLVCVCRAGGMLFVFELPDPGMCHEIEADLRSRYGSAACRLRPR